MSLDHNYEEHPAATLFPMMDQEAYEQLKQDIKDHGQQEDILLWHDGTILDGRNRLKACLELGKEPEIAQVDYDTLVDPFVYVLSKNLHRRHLTTSQRAMVAAKLANLKHGSNRFEAKVEGSFGPSTDIDSAAASLSVSPKSVKRAKKILSDGDEELIHEVEQGHRTVGSAVAKLSPKVAEPSQELDEDEDEPVEKFNRRLATKRLQEVLRRELSSWPSHCIDEAAEVIQDVLRTEYLVHL